MKCTHVFSWLFIVLCAVLSFSFLLIPLNAMASASSALESGGVRISGSFQDVINNAKQKVFPAVIFIKCVRDPVEADMANPLDVSGSGVVISASGEALTNWHVVEKSRQIRCLLYDGTTCEAKIKGMDKDTDIALLQLQLDKNEPPPSFAVLGNSDSLKEGDFVMAMGAPWGLSRSVSMGIISCTRRFLPEKSEYSLWLQTDAAISPGNSGGPLVNSNGEVIGINTLSIIMGGDIGFSIPSGTVKLVTDQIRQHGHVKWSWTGLRLQPLKDFNRNIFFEGNEGVVVAEVDPKSPAAMADIRPRDRILSINDMPVKVFTEEDMPEVRRLLGMLPVQKPAELELLRQDKKMKVSLLPEEKGSVTGDEFFCPGWDLTAKTINRFDSPSLYHQKNQGVFVSGVKPFGNAMNAFLQVNDIILKVDDAEVKTLDQLKEVHKKSMEKKSGRPRLLMTVMRNRQVRQIVLDISKNKERE